MASYLSSIYGSEQDKVNCSFYLKIGACRHNERCSRKHIKPQFSQTIVMPNMFQNPLHSGSQGNPSMSPDEVEEYFQTFYEDVFCEMTKYGNILEMHVCDNVGDHLIGNVYVRYEWEDEAQAAVDDLNNRWYGGRPIYAELSPVTDFREACCRQNDLGECNRGGFCNFMHLREPPTSMLKELHHQQRVQRRLFPSERDIERKKEMEMFQMQYGGAASSSADDRDRRDRDRR